MTNNTKKKRTLPMILETTNSGINGIYVGKACLRILIIVLILPQSMYSKTKYTTPSS